MGSGTKNATAYGFFPNLLINIIRNHVVEARNRTCRRLGYADLVRAFSSGIPIVEADCSASTAIVISVCQLLWSDSVTKILLIEDDKDLAKLVSNSLKADNFEVEVTYDGGSGMEYVRQGHYDVIILDWGLPEISGLEICRRFRDSKGTTPILMLTGKDQIHEKEEGLNSGADDYLTKPFNMRELTARVRALARRSANSVSTLLQVKHVQLDPVKYKIWSRGKEVHVPPKDFRLLEFFMRHPDEIFSSDTLVRRVWDLDAEVSSDALRAAIRRLRKVIDETDDESDSMIENVRRVGYRLRLE